MADEVSVEHSIQEQEALTQGAATAATAAAATADEETPPADTTTKDANPKKEKDRTRPIIIHIAHAAMETGACCGGCGSCCRPNSKTSCWHPTHATVTTGDGEQYEWNARAHRKMRYPLHIPTTTTDASKKQEVLFHHPTLLRHRFRLVCWEPYIVTWYICWIGVIANTLWVVNGVYAVWPELADKSAENITFITGVVGAFLFIVGGYLGYVEAINQTYQELQLPPPPPPVLLEDSDDDKTNAAAAAGAAQRQRQNQPRTFSRPTRHNTHYGSLDHPLGAHFLTPVDQKKLLAKGYPLLVVDHTADTPAGASGDDDEQKDEEHLIRGSELFDPNPKRRSSDEEEEQNLVGKNLVVLFAGRRIGVQITSIASIVEKEKKQEEGDDNDDVDEKEKNYQGYVWWTWQPDLQYVGITNALIFFVATIVFFIPAVVWYPMANNESPTSSVVFWDYILQIIPSIAFVYVGFATMLEATGSWIVPQFNNIGWWIGWFNMIGGFGFLLYPILFLPQEVNPSEDLSTLVKWGASFATFWGSCAFWVAGILQCIEFSSQHPIRIKKSVPSSSSTAASSPKQ